MPSPFPGMNPYLEQEQAWHDFHESFMPAAREVLSAQVQPAYFVKIDEHIYIHELAEETRRFVGRADLGITRHPKARRSSKATTLLEGPVSVHLPAVDVERQSYLEIRDRENRQLITVVELLSPSNKRLGPDHDQYLAKWKTLLSSSVHLVEIDLLRGGARMPWQKLPACDYCAVVSRAEQRPEARAWPIALRERLPVIGVPLRRGEKDAKLDLQQLLHRVYDAAGYELYIYTGQPDPPLSAKDASWAKKVLSKRP